MPNIRISKILPNPDQPRTDFPQDELNILADSIKRFGVINAVSLEKIGTSYILIDGERRLRAAKLAGLKTIPATIKKVDSDEDDSTRLDRAMVSNIQRADMNPIDEAKAYQRMKTERGMTVMKISRIVGVSQPRVDGRLQLLKLDPPIQDLVAEGKLQKDPRVSKALLSIKNKNTRIKLAKRLAYPGINIGLVVSSAKKINDRLNGNKEIIEGPPAVHFGSKRAKSRRDIPIYTQLEKSGRLPPWDLLLEGAKGVCKACSLFDHASASICIECPAVQLITDIVELTERLKVK